MTNAHVPIARKRPIYLVCVSNSDYSKVALEFASQVALKKEGQLVVLHVTEPIDFKSFGSVANKMQEERKKEANKLLRDLTRSIKVEKTLLHREGFIDEEIIKVVEENSDISMLIVGAAAETSPKSKTLHPLVSQVGHKLPIPMLIVPGNLAWQQIEILV